MGVVFIDLDGRNDARGPQDLMNIKISGQGGVVGSVAAAADGLGAEASAELSRHRQTGHAHIDVQHEGTDSFVFLVDEAALSIEFGHMVGGKFEDAQEPEFVPGLHIITGLM